MLDRRQFLQAGAYAVAGTPFLRESFASRYSLPVAEAIRAVPFPELTALAQRALDAAVHAGAQFADVRVTRTLEREVGAGDMYSGGPFNESLDIGFGVRVLMDGFWGFAASVTWTPDEAVRLARNAVAQAKGYRWSSARDLGWTAPAKPAVGEWTMPVKRDALDMPPAELRDYMDSIPGLLGEWFPTGSFDCVMRFQRRDRVYVSSEGASTTQRTYASSGRASVMVMQPYAMGGGLVRLSSRLVDPVSGSYDYFTGSPLVSVELPQLYEDAMRMPAAQPVDVGRYDMVFDAYAMAAIVGETIGVAAAVDRARGYEANAAGTSYLGPVDQHLGQTLAPSFVTIRGDRSQPHGAATMRWDDDGVEPETFDLVRNGQVVDYATSREHLPLMESWYAQHGQPRRSHGCAFGQNGCAIPLVCTPNLTLAPGAADVTFEQLVADTKDGVAVMGGNALMDQQQLTGQGMATLWRIKNGKLTTPIRGGAYLFRSPEFWKGIQTIGGASSVVSRGLTVTKGQPAQRQAYTVQAVPAKVRNLAMIDVMAHGEPLTRSGR